MPSKSAKNNKTLKKTAGKKAKSSKKNPEKNSAAQSKKSKKNDRLASNRNPMFVLIIMGLLIVIISLLNRFYQDSDDSGVTRNGDILTPEKMLMEDQEEESIAPPHTASKQVSAKSEDNQAEGGDIDVKIYFIKLNQRTEKLYLSTVRRKVDRNTAIKEVLKELITGPAQSEKNQGFLTAVPGDLRVRKIRILGKIAEIDFSSEIEKGAEGNILLNRIDQIVYTVTQFENINSVMIKINGRTKKILGNEGLSIGGPLHRRG